MKKILFIAALLCLLVTSTPVSALTKIVNVSSLEGELTQALRNQVQGLGHNDTIYINFDRVGCDTIRGTVTAYCNVIDTLDLVFNNNLFVSNDMNFFLQEFASHGSLTFDYNNVYVKTSGGKLMTHWSSNPTSSMRFTDLEVKNNLFRGVKSIDNLLINITNVDNRIIKTRV